MVEVTLKNINDFCNSHDISLKKSNIIKLNAKFIDESEMLTNNKIDSIISE
jgi:hypothetical protein